MSPCLQLFWVDGGQQASTDAHSAPVQPFGRGGRGRLRLLSALPLVGLLPVLLVVLLLLRRRRYQLLGEEAAQLQ